MSPLEDWKQQIAAMERPTILDTGVKPWAGSPPNDHQQFAPNGKWTGTDIEAGEGVDIVADLQFLSDITQQRFSSIFSVSTLEHVQRPWQAVRQMAKTLRTSGLLYIETHQTFPLHGYPHDYFRFSTEALATMATDAGLTVLNSGYSYPCTITPPSSVTRWNTHAAAYLNVAILAVKP